MMNEKTCFYRLETTWCFLAELAPVHYTQVEAGWSMANVLDEQVEIVQNKVRRCVCDPS